MIVRSALVCISVRVCAVSAFGLFIGAVDFMAFIVTYGKMRWHRHGKSVSRMTDSRMNPSIDRVRVPQPNRGVSSVLGFAAVPAELYGSTKSLSSSDGTRSGPCLWLHIWIVRFLYSKITTVWLWFLFYAPVSVFSSNETVLDRFVSFFGGMGMFQDVCVDKAEALTIPSGTSVSECVEFLHRLREVEREDGQSKTVLERLFVVDCKTDTLLGHVTMSDLLLSSKIMKIEVNEDKLTRSKAVPLLVLYPGAPTSLWPIAALVLLFG